jgi:hypothetical protein
MSAFIRGRLANNEWFLDSQQNTLSNGAVLQNGCAFLSSPLNAKSGCVVLCKASHYDWITAFHKGNRLRNAFA